jgi:hypothetical protein
MLVEVKVPLPILVSTLRMRHLNLVQNAMVYRDQFYGQKHFCLELVIQIGNDGIKLAVSELFVLELHQQ